MNVSHCDLYFMLQWFYPISERSFGKWTSYFQIIKYYDTMFGHNMNAGQYDLYFNGPVILLYMWKTIWHINIIPPDYEMVLHNIWPEYECWSVWPTGMFNGPVILLYIWKSIWHMKIILPVNPSQHDWKIVYRDVKQQSKKNTSR